MAGTELEQLLASATRLGLAIRREYAKIKSDPDARYFTYVLQLQEGRFYVGTTDNIFTRLLDHHLMSTSSALWVKHHGPIERVVEVCRNSKREDELYKTLQYMTMFGFENVRGSSYCRIQMFNPPEALKAFVRDRDGDFCYLSRKEIDDVVAEVHDLVAESARS